MGYTIYWSPAAKNDYINILEYLNTRWGQQEVTSFISRTDKTLQLIRANPRLFVSSAKKTCRTPMRIDQPGKLVLSYQ